MIIIAIDPGATGAIAWHDSVDKTCFVERMPETLKDKKVFLDELSRDDMTECVMEDVGTHIQGNNAVASAKFARHVGELWGILVTLGVPVRSVKPTKWQKSIPNMPQRPPAPKRSDYHIMPSGYEQAKAKHKKALAEHKKKCKARIKDEMQCRYPHLRVTLINADALGILTWALDNEKNSV